MALESEKRYQLQVEQTKILSHAVTEMTPKAEFFDAVTDSTTTISMGDAAKVLNMGLGRNNLIKFLRSTKILNSKNVPYQRYIDLGYFRVVERKFSARNGETHISVTTLVYQKGLDFIRRTLISR
ncbi:MAG: phage antirepressor KilAC domain-containing protein [Syntrophobacteraceae bacterium]|nr:phage antirepressor KilAC domain-containing protein [Desulfobacteraceae bacterium]